MKSIFFIIVVIIFCEEGKRVYSFSHVQNRNCQFSKTLAEPLKILLKILNMNFSLNFTYTMRERNVNTKTIYGVEL